uniref:Uncharacterized protein n=1 Tax=Knipowitschia caucasica TaxID=637954 RepID=A0AAV2M7F8_KNICA
MGMFGNGYGVVEGGMGCGERVVDNRGGRVVGGVCDVCWGGVCVGWCEGGCCVYGCVCWVLGVCVVDLVGVVWGVVGGFCCVLWWCVGFVVCELCCGVCFGCCGCVLCVGVVVCGVVFVLFVLVVWWCFGGVVWVCGFVWCWYCVFFVVVLGGVWGVVFVGGGLDWVGGDKGVV